MTRFERELNGELGTFWKADAEKKIEKMNEEIANGLITIDDDGVARNRLGRTLMEDQMEILGFTNCVFSKEATMKARMDEVAKAINEYKNNSREPNFEEMEEMKNVFGAGAKVVDVISGKMIQL